MSKDINFTFVDGYEEKKDTDGFIRLVPKVYNVSLNAHGIKRYYNALMVLTGISGTAHDLMNWLVEQMDYDNRVYNSVSERNKFIRFLQDANAKNKEKADVPTERTVESCFLKLADRNLLIPERRGAYIVNPAFFMKDTNEKARKTILRLMMEFKDGEDTTIASSINDGNGYSDIVKKKKVIRDALKNKSE